MDKSCLISTSAIFLLTIYCGHCYAWMSAQQSQTLQQYVQSRFTPPSRATLNQTAIFGDKLYVGGENWLYQLDKNLNLVQSVKTGPVLDHVNCKPYADTCSERELTNNTNQLLLVDKQNNRLIVCGTVYQGTCKTRSLTNISEVYYEISNSSSSSSDLVAADFVACNQESCSTVGIITEGPTVNNNVLYAAATVTSSHLNPDYSIATHSLHHNPNKENKLFRLAIDTVSEKSTVTLSMAESSSRQYKYTFATGNEDGFVYFVFFSPQNKVSKTVVARICKSDPVYFSYMQIPIVCGNKNDLLQAANYVPDTSDVNSDGTIYFMTYSRELAGSNLCSIRKSRLDQMFYNTMETCYKDRGYDSNGMEIATTIGSESANGCDTNPPRLDKNDNLTDIVVIVPQLNLPYYSNYKVPKKQILCGALYLPGKITRLAPTLATTIYQKVGVNFTAITTYETGSNNKSTIAFIGTTSGTIIQVNLNTSDEFANIPVEKPVIGEFLWDPTPNLDVPRLYVTTESEVLLINVAACQRFTTCEACITTKDPFCGWCILESRCSTEAECSTADLDKTRWLGPDAAQCISINQPAPRERSLNGDITTTVYLLPVLDRGDKYICKFNDQFESPVSTKKDGSSTEITCKAPNQNQLPPSLHKKDYVNVTLSLLYERTQVKIVSTTAIFFDCHAHGINLHLNSPCSGCVSSQWGCDWYIQEHKCLAKEEEACGAQCITQASQCPTLDTIKKEDRLIPVNEERTITLYGHNLPDQGTYSCHITIGNDNSTQVKATRNGDQVTCNPHKYNYSQDTVEAEATIMIRWKLSFVMDYQETTPLMFYKCSVNNSDCSLCVTADQRYKCGWCSSTQTCTIQNSCPANTWITEGLQCPQHQITGFTPAYGPLLGGTIVTISGINMGTLASDIQRVTVADQACKILYSLYKTSLQVACTTQSVISPKSGKVAVTIRNITKFSKLAFEYRNPTLSRLVTRQGPMAGGTSVNITGHNLNTGSDIRVTIGKGAIQIPCQRMQYTNSYLQCITSPATEPRYNQTVFVQFDDLKMSLPNSFQYTPNPKVTSMYTYTPATLTSFLGGGRNISIIGTNLDSVAYPSLFAVTGRYQILNPTRQKRSQSAEFVRKLRKRSLKDIDRTLSAFTANTYGSICIVKNATYMICPTPKVFKDQLMNASANISQNVQVPAKLNLKLDNHDINLASFGDLIYFPNPYVDMVDNSKKYSATNILYLTAYNLNERAVTKEEVVVMVGKKRCPVATLDGEKILCELPSKGEGVRFPVQVTIGNLRFEVGEIEYQLETTAIPETTLRIIIIAVVVTVVLFVGFTIFFCYRKSKSYKANKNDFQKAMASMEMSVRADFRKAFAELSIDMSDLTADVGDYGIPCLDYRTYITNLFFPGCRYHPCMKEPDPTTEIPSDLEQGLSQFLLLLSNHNFLTVLIHTLEEQKSFSTRDKGNVASLLSVVLHHKLDYFTEIMKSLVSDLIGVNVQRNPKLIMRRSDSVAERMLSNWMYICLYPYIRDSAGSQLFLLLKAIKQQVSKGPLDAITGKARYTLNDDRLLKEDIEFNNFTLFVQSSNEEEPVMVKVLSCDSVAQVKEKVMDAVYKRVPFSKRPKPEQLDIEWRHGRGGHLVLPNQDFTIESGSRWRRLMCITDYKVGNNATLALLRRQQDFQGSQDLSTASLDASPMSPMLPEDGTAKMYHLVKYTDDTEAKRESTIKGDRHKHIPELYLLRLVNMKGILQNYVDGLMQAILNRESIPCPVRHFFHFLDEIAAQNGITDPEILHIWKTNSFLSRFWVTILKNPEAAFDIEKPDTIASSMAVISQTFIDACSVNEHQPTKDSPINKQIYAKEIPTYKKMVQDYYKAIKEQHPVSDQDVNTYIADISRSNACEFDKNVALRELWGFVSKYYEEINEALENDANVASNVISKLSQTYGLVENSAANGL